jgi:hypothetical protein
MSGIPLPVIAALYEAFASYRRRPSIDACPHCVGEARREALARAPLHELRPEQLSPYAFRALTTWGEPVDYKHFLPRILELAATPAGVPWPGFQPDIIAAKLELAGWKQWPARERDVVVAWYDSACEWALGPEPDGWSESAIEALSHLIHSEGPARPQH